MKGRDFGEDASVTAKSDEFNQHVEVAKVEADGTFRLMGLQPGSTYEVSVLADSIDRTLPGTRTITILNPTQDRLNSDVEGIKFVAIERSNQFDLAGSVFFEGETTQTEYPMLYREAPQIIVQLFTVEENKRREAVDSFALTVSHLFEFHDLDRSKSYELVFKSLRPLVDRRHESSVTVPV